MVQKLKTRIKERNPSNINIETIHNIIDEVACEFKEETEEQYDER